jgi:molybdopterin synthase catalytic subunit
VEYLTREPIDVAGLMAAVAGSGRGGAVVFLGSVRQTREDGPVSAIDYEAYEAMAADEFGRIVEEARAQWPEAGVSVQHRLGHVPLGEPSIAVAAAAAHRAEAFAACRWVVDEAKRRLPIWKRERFEDGSTRWREE